MSQKKMILSVFALSADIGNIIDLKLTPIAVVRWVLEQFTILPGELVMTMIN